MFSFSRVVLISFMIDIFLMAASTGISTIASTIQQIHDVTFYEDIMREQFIRKTDFYNNPELAIANGSYGMDLVLYYIRMLHPPLTGFRLI